MKTRDDLSEESAYIGSPLVFIYVNNTAILAILLSTLSMKTRHFLLMAIGIAAFSPITVLAAAQHTPQQAFQQAWTATLGNPKDPIRVSAEFSMNYVKTENGKQTSSANISGTAMLRRRGTAPWGRQDSEGQFAFTKMIFSAKDTPSITSNMPFSLEWKQIDKISYLRIKAKTLPDSTTKQIPTLARINNVWLFSEPSTSTASSMDSASLLRTTPIETNATLSALQHPEIFTVTRVERTTTRSDGSRVLRMRLALNGPAYDRMMNMLIQNATAALKKKNSETSQIPSNIKLQSADEQALANLRKDAAARKAQLRASHFVAVVNTKTNTLERLEISSPLTDSYTTANKVSVKERGTLTLGVNFKRDGNWTVAKPSPGMSLNDAILGIFMDALSNGAPQTFTQTTSSTPTNNTTSTASNETVNNTTASNGTGTASSTILYTASNLGVQFFIPSTWTIPQGNQQSNVVFFSGSQGAENFQTILYSNTNPFIARDAYVNNLKAQSASGTIRIISDPEAVALAHTYSNGTQVFAQDKLMQYSLISGQTEIPQYEREIFMPLWDGSGTIAVTYHTASQDLFSANKDSIKDLALSIEPIATH
jgi:hypothetical protein